MWSLYYEISLFCEISFIFIWCFRKSFWDVTNKWFTKTTFLWTWLLFVSGFILSGKDDFFCTIPSWPKLIRLIDNVTTDQDGLCGGAIWVTVTCNLERGRDAGGLRPQCGRIVHLSAQQHVAPFQVWVQFAQFAQYEARQRLWRRAPFYQLTRWDIIWFLWKKLSFNL